MVFISPQSQQRLVEVDTKTKVRQTVTSVFLAVTITTAAAALVGMIATAISYAIQSGT